MSETKEYPRVLSTWSVDGAELRVVDPGDGALAFQERGWLASLIGHDAQWFVDQAAKRIAQLESQLTAAQAERDAAQAQLDHARIHRCGTCGAQTDRCGDLCSACSRKKNAGEASDRGFDSRSAHPVNPAASPALDEWHMPFASQAPPSPASGGVEGLPSAVDCLSEWNAHVITQPDCGALDRWNHMLAWFGQRLAPSSRVSERPSVLDLVREIERDESTIDIAEKILSMFPAIERQDGAACGSCKQAYRVIANAHECDWSKASPGWRRTAEVWRDRWYATLRGAPRERQEGALEHRMTSPSLTACPWRQSDE